MDTLFIHQLKITTLIGINPDERIHPQTLHMNIAMQYDVSDAAQADDIKHAVNYANVTLALEHLTATTQFNLIETLAERACETLLSQFSIHLVTLTICKKPADMPNVDHVGITLTRPSQSS